MRSLLPLDLRALDRAELAAYFDDTWGLYETLFGAVADEAIQSQPDPLRNALIFYVGHTAAFYVNKLRLAGLMDRGQHPRLDPLFAVGVDPHTADELDAGIDWPDRATTAAYRREIYGRVRDLIERVELDRPVGWGDPLWALMMGLEHDRIHFETSSVLIRQVPVEHLRRPEGWEEAPDVAPAARRWIPVPARRVALGRPDDAPWYGWDNEFGRLEVDVAPFEATADLVTNRDFAAFVEAGGYDQRDLWGDEGWGWIRAHGVRRPRFWSADRAPRYRAMFDWRPMPWSWPVEVCAHEAEAYCRWLAREGSPGARLMTEAEYMSMAQDAPLVDGDSPGHRGYNLNLRFGSPWPAGWSEAARSALGFSDVYGNVWQWLSDDFRPLPGFRTHPWYADFSEPYFDALHASMRGGAWATTGAGASRHYRLWFRRHFYQHAGFRIARDLR